MSQSLLSSEIRQLSVPERVQLVEQIWDSIAEDEKEFRLTEAQQSELDRRIAAQKVDPGRGSPWHEVKKRLAGDA